MTAIEGGSGATAGEAMTAQLRKRVGRAGGKERREEGVSSIAGGWPTTVRLLVAARRAGGGEGPGVGGADD